MDLREIVLPFGHEIERLEKVIRSHLNSNVPFVGSVVEYVIQNGGKRLRPVLTLISARLSSYQGSESLSIGAAIEFMHTASLLHDDVLDNATLRRGRATINKKWGNHVSVLVGDFFYCRAMDILVKHGDLRILRVVTDAVTSLTEGEILEIIKTNDPTLKEEEYLKIITGKTAELIAAACQAGAIMGKLSGEFEQALRQYGLCLGIAFQLVDDVLDYTAQEEEFGKINGTDLKEGKLTLPLLLALKRCNEEETILVKNALVAESINADVFKTIFGIIHKYEGVRDTLSLAQNYVERAKKSLDPFRPSLEKDSLCALADYVLMRKN
ncbi:MAG TPA: octaprenyl diphosphate synthase [Deltaproteobacteria bacterium]|nr:MAG: hypothetical protein A2048_10245 [Deltaproteobacteria bacterium GWA2_45_12]HBF13519.1 octaprenyl diphosphate synthase [Deltaproteobacteria bacterium]